MEKQRIHFYDNLKGVLILLVVFGHVISPVSGNSKDEFYFIFKIIYLFHMPIFIYISGVFSKNKYSFKELFSKLFFPLLFFQIIYSLEEYIINGITFDLKRFLIEPFSILWYLNSLLLWRIFLSYFHPRKSILVLFVFILISCLIGIIGYINTFFSLSRTFFFLPFFYLGFSVKNTNYIEIVNFCRKYKYLFASGLLIALIFFIKLDYFKIDKSMYLGSLPFKVLNVSALEGITFRFLYIMIAMCVLGLILTFINNAYSILSVLGKKSLEIYLFHFIWIRIAFSLGFYESDEGFSIKFIIYFVFTIFITYLCTLNFLSSFVINITKLANFIYERINSFYQSVYN